MRSLDGTETVERSAERINYSADHGVTYRNRGELTGAAHLVALFDLQVVAEDHGTDRGLLEVEDLSLGTVLEREQFTGHGVVETVDAGDSVAHLEYLTDLAEVDVTAILANLLGDHRRDLIDSELHSSSSLPVENAFPLRSSADSRLAKRSLSSSRSLRTLMSIF